MLLAVSGVAIALAAAIAGCGHSTTAKPRASQVERADLIAASRALSAAQHPVSVEVAATKAAWPLVANGLPAGTGTLARTAISTAAARASALAVPAVFAEHRAATLTGPGASLAGLFHAYSGLSSRGWRLIDAAVKKIEHGSLATAAFARSNVALYIDSVYDAHFSLAQIGKHLTRGYHTLGGPDAFGGSLTQAEVDSLAHAYSEENDRLHPHPSVRLGS